MADEATPKKVVLAEKDADTIRKVFCENDDLLQATRALLFGLELSEADKQMVKSAYADPELRDIMHRRFLPQFTRDTPVGQAKDVWQGAEDMVFGMSRDTIAQAVEYKDRAAKMLEKALKLLENPDGERVVLAKYGDEGTSLTEDPLQIWLLARNSYTKVVETQLTFLYVIANQKKETPTQAAKRAEKDSAE